ncbi:hypothetical protein Y023_5701 [Burkholderia pseudomallei A79D]|nr:hypothetical protein X941_5718 [Burkholderia pseudomallei MSHR5569]KGX94680.1 hypothetical protein Y023_5701 [Burkholderia pseudomallei A79D]
MAARLVPNLAINLIHDTLRLTYPSSAAPGFDVAPPSTEPRQPLRAASVVARRERIRSRPTHLFSTLPIN